MLKYTVHLMKMIVVQDRYLKALLNNSSFAFDAKQFRAVFTR